MGTVGHAGPIANIGWLAGDGNLITIGRKDHAVLQWKCVYDEARESGDEGGLSCEDSAAERDVGCEGAGVVRKSAPPEEIPHWQTVISPPSDVVDYDESAPPLKGEFEVSVDGGMLSVEC